MTTTQELRKPVFVKVKDLQKERSGYNVIVKVVSADIQQVQTKNGLKIKMVNATVGDQTGVAKAFFKGDSAALIEKGKVIAIRNGVKRFIKNFISLQLDIFGRVTSQKAEVTVNQKVNISQVEHKLEDRPIRQGFNNRGRRDNRRGNFNNRRPFNKDNNRDSRREDYRRNDNRRDNNRDRQDRFGRNNDRQGRNYNRDDRRDNRDNDRRPARRQYDRDFDRRRQNNQGPRRQNRFEEKTETRRQQFRQRRSPIQWIKVQQISPGDQKLNILAKIVSLEIVQGRRTMARCVIGDQTGIVNAFLPQSNKLQVGASIALFGVQSRVVKEHIEIQTGRYGRVQQARKQVKNLNQKFNLSQKSWVPID